jgi:hypothetical protein
LGGGIGGAVVSKNNAYHLFWCFDSILSSQVLSTLPSDTHLKGLYPFFEKSIRESNRAHYENMIVKNLLKAEQLQVSVFLELGREHETQHTVMFIVCPCLCDVLYP